MSTADAREARLPVWARVELDRLRRVAEDARRERDEARLLTAPERSSALLDPWADIPVGLGEKARVRFVLGADDGRQWLDVHVVHDYVTGRSAVEVMGGDTLTVRPQSGNVVVVGLTR
jgi:hypothetical protein